MPRKREIPVDPGETDVPTKVRKLNPEVNGIPRKDNFFRDHFESNLPEGTAAALIEKQSSRTRTKSLELGSAGAANYRCPSSETAVDFDAKLGPEALGVRKNLLGNIEMANDGPLNDLQQSLAQLLCRYSDLYFPGRTQSNGEQILLLYCVHALNHALKTRHRVLQHNTRLRLAAENGQQTDDSDDLRDQGLTRPKVLILVPFRDAALHIVDRMAKLLFGASARRYVTNLKRFKREYQADSTEPDGVRADAPSDLKQLLKGNVDDCFRLGLGIAKKSLKLYVDFYSADIIVASPLGLRMIVGEEEEKASDYDFLSSIEVLIMDQTDVFLMQNWQHLVHLMQRLHAKPKEAHGVDFSRVRMWTLNGWAQLYRQTLMFSALSLPELKAIFSRFCNNYAGLVSILPAATPSGCLVKIIVNLPQAFQRFPCAQPSDQSDARFEYFIKNTLPQYEDSSMSHTLVLVPDYFDFVRLRNYFKRQSLSFVQMCEYNKKGKISRARDWFLHGRKNLMLVTERLHFFRRFRIRGIQHLIFYQLPIYPHFYSEFCNMVQDTLDNEEGTIVTCTALFCKYDALRLSAVVGQERAQSMIESDKPTHMLMTQ